MKTLAILLLLASAANADSLFRDAYFVEPEAACDDSFRVMHAGPAAVTTTGGDPSTCRARCQRREERCLKDCPATPTPTAAPTPKPTGSPLPCEPIGGLKTYQPGESKMLCFNMPADPAKPFVEVAVVNLGNTGCGELEATLTAPSGLSNYSYGAQPNTIVARGSGGKFYLSTRLVWGCPSYTFTPR